MKKTKTDLAIEAAVDIFKDRIDVDCKHGSGFFKEHVNKDGSVERRPFGFIVGRYWCVSINGIPVQAHRLRWNITNGMISQGAVINHIDNNTNNNSIENLEMVSRSKNSINRLISDRNKSGVPGVSLKHNKWSVQIGYNGFKISFGTFNNFNVARIIRDRFFIKTLLCENINLSNKYSRRNFIQECYEALILTNEQCEIVKKYKHLIYSTIEEICVGSYEFKLRQSKESYSKKLHWSPDINSQISIEEQIYLKVIDEFEDRRELGLWRKCGKDYKKIENKKNINGYILCKVGSVRVFAHRIIWMINHGILRSNEIIDHIDGNRSNNLIENLQISSNLLNSRKRLRNKKSNYDYVGVRERYNKYCAYIHMFKCEIFLGTYITMDEAILVRDRAYTLRLIEDPIIKNKEDVVNLINRCKNKLNLSEKDIELLKNNITGLNNKDLSVL